MGGGPADLPGGVLGQRAACPRRRVHPREDELLWVRRLARDRPRDARRDDRKSPRGDVCERDGRGGRQERAGRGHEQDDASAAFASAGTGRRRRLATLDVRHAPSRRPGHLRFHRVKRCGRQGVCPRQCFTNAVWVRVSGVLAMTRESGDLRGTTSGGGGRACPRAEEARDRRRVPRRARRGRCSRSPPRRTSRPPGTRSRMRERRSRGPSWP